MSADVVPRSVRNWFKATYPTLAFEETWLTQCCQYLQTHFELTAPQLIKKVENQLLLSDLSTSTSPSPSSLPSTISIDVPFADLPKLLVLSDRAILVQIQSITEIGHSAIALETVHQKRLNEAQGRDRVLDLEDEESNDQHAPIVFPRAMLKLELSDGHTVAQAIEYKRIEGLKLGETPLGCKLVIKSVKVQRGVLLLTPDNTVVKDFRVDELDSQRDRLFQEGLDKRLGRTGDGVHPEAEQAARNALHQPANPTRTSASTASIINTSSNPRTGQPPQVIELSDSDDYFDDNSDFEAQLLAHEI